MNYVTLGKSEIKAARNGFGALPIQRISHKDAAILLRRAFDGGVNFFDTARFYTDSEEKIALGLKDVREQIYIASKTMALKVEDFWRDLETSLKNLQTDYLDLYQFHNPAFCPKPEDGTGLYEAMLEAQQAGKIRHIGITNHRLEVAHQALDSGLYETLQFPFCHLADAKDLALVAKCRENNVGFIAMKALSGGLLTNAKLAYAYMAKFEHVLPIWGIQKISELDEFLGYQSEEPQWDLEMQSAFERDRNELAGQFCRCCGYCQPCPAGIEISNCARMSWNLRRMPSERWLDETWQQAMAKIDKCLECGLCIKKCPYNLNVPEVLKLNYEDYKKVLSGKTKV